MHPQNSGLQYMWSLHSWPWCFVKVCPRESLQCGGRGWGGHLSQQPSQSSHGHCCPKHHPTSLTVRRPTGAGSEERDYSALLAWRKGKVNTSPPFLACLHLPFPPQLEHKIRTWPNYRRGLTMAFNIICIFSRPGQSQGLLYKHFC